MPSADKPVQAAPIGLPEGYLAVPITVEQNDAPVRVCVLARREPDPVAGHLVVLRDMIEAQVLLGALTDASGQVHQWIELWVQNLDGLSTAVPAYVQALSNEVLDKRWTAQARTFLELDQTTVLRSGWESKHPRPTFLDLSEESAVHPRDEETGAYWQLCQDDALLKGKGLPPYSTSLHRYLYLPELENDTAFIAVTRESPTNDSVKPLSDITGRHGKLAPFNAGAGLMMVRPFEPVKLEAMIDLLTSGVYDGLTHGRQGLDLGGAVSVLAAKGEVHPASEGRLFMGQHGRWGRITETFHLKLRLVADAIAAVESFARQSQRPILNLKADSYRVRLGDPSVALPFLWTTRVKLVDAGNSIVLPIQSSDAEYYLPGNSASTSIYTPDSADVAAQGRGTLRIRQVLDTKGGVIIVEGTFTTQERITPAKFDLAWFRLDLKSGRVDLYARLEKEKALAEDEWRFRTVGQRLSEATVTDLREAEGVPMKDTWFEVIPLLSTPCDLYALAVLAVRTLLVNKQTRLAASLDEMISLARQAAAIEDDEASLQLRIQHLFDQDSRWAENLGPHRLVDETVEVDEAFDLVPAELWWDMLAMIARMFPGLGRDSRCKDFGDAPPGGVHKIFDQVTGDVENLLLRTRSLIVIDWRYNREVHRVLRRLMTGLGEASQEAATA